MKFLTLAIMMALLRMTTGPNGKPTDVATSAGLKGVFDGFSQFLGEESLEGGTRKQTVSDQRYCMGHRLV
ncbi:unnamed protein product [Strongylus vulgaris]|uniref:Uncharacterized protein n=1 Tax=Strongylus vulgaris TaxID=40348 RepID=A0A3P7JN08_STRVU|nr:unnamed protein product [Strongylus vulgaris]